MKSVSTKFSAGAIALSFGLSLAQPCLAAGTVPGGAPSDGVAKILDSGYGDTKIDLSKSHSLSLGGGMNSEGKWSGEGRLKLRGDFIPFGGSETQYSSAYSTDDMDQTQLGLLTLPLSLDASVRAGQITTLDPKSSIEKAEARITGPALGSFYNQFRDTRVTPEIVPAATTEVHFFKTGAQIGFDRELTAQVATANLDLIDLSGHIAFSVNEIPFEVCGNAAFTFRAGAATFRESHRPQGYLPGGGRVMVCGGFSVGEWAHVRDTVSVEGYRDLTGPRFNYKVENELSVSKFGKLPIGVSLRTESEHADYGPGAEKGVIRNTLNGTVVF